MKKSVAAGFTFALIAAISTPAVAQDTKGQSSKEQSAKEQSAKEETKQKTKTEKANARASASTEPVVMTVTTVTFAESTGCWARIHDGESFTGRTMTLMGAQSLPNLEFGIGSDWEGDIDSIEVGPKAKLTLYDDENFADDPREIGPNGRVADLHESLFDEGIESMKLTCTESAPSNHNR